MADQDKVFLHTNCPLMIFCYSHHKFAERRTSSNMYNLLIILFLIFVIYLLPSQQFWNSIQRIHSQIQFFQNPGSFFVGPWEGLELSNYLQCVGKVEESYPQVHLQIYFNFVIDIIDISGVPMLRLSFGFSLAKLKPTQIGIKTSSPGLKPAPMALKSAPLNQANVKVGANLDKTAKKPVQQTKIVEEAPIFKQKHAVITIMGHVDHGKTTLIDYLRNSDIAAKQDGGITQRIGAFRINCLGRRLTFIDTPGHEAFVNMRQRGASVTDLVVLVVSATEGVKKQTLEVIQLIKKLQIPVIVAINKIDLPQANPEQVEAELEKAGLKLEINGGDIPVVHISAKNGINIDLLCQLLVEQTKNTTAIYNGLACASVLQAYQNKEGLNAMTVIIQKGVLKTNAIIIIGKESFKVKTILDDRGEVLQEAFPGQAVQIVGLPFIPAPGDMVLEVENQSKAKFILQNTVKKNYEQSRVVQGQQKEVGAKIHFERSREGRKQKRAFFRGVRQVWMNKFAEQEQKLVSKIEQLKEKEPNEMIEMTIMELEDELQKHRQYVYQYLRNTGDSPDTLNFLMKFGDRGMEETILLKLETLKASIEEQTKVKLNLIKTDVGDVTISDLEEAKNCSAKIFTFGAGVSSQAKAYLDGTQPPRVHKLIHTFLKDLKDSSFSKKLSIVKGTERGRSQVAEVFTIKLKKKQSMIPGIKVTSGKILKKCKAYIFRDGVPITSGLDISFLKSFKKEMLELKRGQEGTIGFMQEIEDIKPGDELVFYQQN